MLKHPWKTVAAAALPLLALIGVANAQDKPAAKIQTAPQGQAQKSQEELIKLRTEKLALEVFKKAPWTFDYDAARAEAKKSGKLIFAYFSRSYAH